MQPTDAEVMDVLAEWAAPFTRGFSYTGSPESRASIINAAREEAARRKNVSE